MAIAYDPSVIEQFAARLYRRAAFIVVQYALVGFLVLPCAVSVPFLISHDALGTPEMGIAGAIGALIGFLIGREKSFTLRLQAQTALCQMEIEKNTRAASRTAALAS